jgi:hypothetical protein
MPRPGPVVIKVCDVAGRVVLNRTLAVRHSGSVALDFRRLNAGVYLARLETADRKASQKLIIER